jgi:hypothetical protein
MTQATMFRAPLETYILDKMRVYAQTTIDSVQVRKIELGEIGCNWDICAIEPRLPDETFYRMHRDVIAPLQLTIVLVD